MVERASRASDGPRSGVAQTQDARGQAPQLRGETAEPARQPRGDVAEGATNPSDAASGGRAQGPRARAQGPGSEDPGQPPGTAEVSAAAVRCYLAEPERPELSESVRKRLRAAVADEPAQARIDLSALNLGASSGAVIRRLQRTHHELVTNDPNACDTLTPPRQPPSTQPPVAKPPVGPRPPAGGGTGLRQPGMLAESILNRGGRNNANSADPLWRTLPSSARRSDDRQPNIDPNRYAADPDAVMTRNRSGSVHPEIRELFESGRAAPNAAEAISEKLLELYGPFNAQNSQANRDAIVANLRWLADSRTGIAYEYERLDSGALSTRAPNETLSRKSGVCRDTHVAVGAMLASLASARRDGDGWALGSPASSQDTVQVIGFYNPEEYHAYMVYRDPADGTWNALEYGKSYDLGSQNAVEAFASLPGYISGYSRFTLRGWDRTPTINNRGAVGAQQARDFFRHNPGTGEPGEVRLHADSELLRATNFFTPHLSLVGELEPTRSSDSLRGGVKLNYHRDVEQVDKQGYLHAAAGIYSDFFDASQYTGLRGADDRTRYHVAVVGLQADARLEGDAVQLLDEHLRLKYGLDFQGMLGLPITTGGGLSGPMLNVGAVGDYSELDVGAELGLVGHEQLSETLSLDWAVHGRADVDVINAGNELAYANFDGVRRSLIQEPWRTSFAVALKQQNDDGSTARFEVGGNQYLAAPYDREISEQENHYAVLALSSANQVVNFGLLARGETVGGDFIPVNGLGIALDLRPSETIELGLGAESVFPDGDINRVGDRVTVSGNLRIKF